MFVVLAQRKDIKQALVGFECNTSYVSGVFMWAAYIVCPLLVRIDLKEYDCFWGAAQWID